jgi:hypothetical protein
MRRAVPSKTTSMSAKGMKHVIGVTTGERGINMWVV